MKPDQELKGFTYGSQAECASRQQLHARTRGAEDLEAVVEEEDGEEEDVDDDEKRREGDDGVDDISRSCSCSRLVLLWFASIEASHSPRDGLAGEQGGYSWPRYPG